MRVMENRAAALIEKDIAESRTGIIARLNTVWHKTALRIFMAIVLAHWAEHLSQAAQIYVLGWPVAEARGVLGLWMPWLVSSEVLHYGYALIMLIGIWTLRGGFEGSSRLWWTIALAIQFWHHIEHALLQWQALAGANLFGAPVPTSILQLWIPRVELHLFYNTIVFIPMVIGMYRHLFPSQSDATYGTAHRRCTCALRVRTA
jgi:hypothetical protein